MIETFLSVIGDWFQVLLPGWVRLPSLTFVLPHALYWSGLIIFPLFALYTIHQNKKKNGSLRQPVSNGAAYLLWLWGGFAGLHRFYLRSYLIGFIYILLFIVVLYGNSQSVVSRNDVSNFANQIKIAEFTVKKQKRNVERGRSGAEEKLEKARKKLAVAKKGAQRVNKVYDRWRALSGGIFAIIVILLAIDAVLIPFYIRRLLKIEPVIDSSKEFIVMERGAKKDERAQITSPTIRFIETISYWSGNFVSYWVIIAVFVYYYEVVARYVFNSPTNWAHESMFLMFGMQYLLTGAYAYHQDSHVRVDVIYEKFSTRTKAKIDLVTSFFFFIFTITLLLTGYLFAKDSFDVLETSFTEWGIQYWPVKMTIVIGAFLLILQGFAKLMRDIIYLSHGEAK